MPKRRGPQCDVAAFDSILDGVRSIYMTKVRPLEEQSLVQHFHYPLLADCDFEARPMVLLVGQYSVGKTSFIRYLLESDFPGMHVGPEPTTDRFQAIMYGAATRELPGNALASNPDTPFYELSRCFGNAFLSKFSGCEVPSLFARGCTLIDTPGVLSGRKQTEDTSARTGRGRGAPTVDNGGWYDVCRTASTRTRTWCAGLRRGPTSSSSCSTRTRWTSPTSSSA